MTLYTTTEFRNNLAEIFAEVSSGKEVGLILGRGPKAKKIKLVNYSVSSKASNSKRPSKSIRHKNIQHFLDSAEFKNYKPHKKILEVKDLKKSLLDDLIA